MAPRRFSVVAILGALAGVATRRLSVVATIAALAVVAACRPDSPAATPSSTPDTPTGAATEEAVPTESPPVVVDAEGREVRLEAPALRVVSLVPSVTEVVLAIGARDRLVGRTDYDADAALAGLPSVGGGLGPNLEALAALDPDLVIRFGGDSDRVTPDRLDDLGIAHAAVRPDRIDDLWTILDQVGALLGLESRTDSLRRVLADGLADIEREVAGRPPVRVAYLMGGSPPWTAGEGTYIDELITLAGGTNALADVGGLYGAVSPEVVATRPLDVILLADGADIDRRLLEGREVRTLSEAVQLPGPRIVDAAREVARALHGTAGGER